MLISLWVLILCILSQSIVCLNNPGRSSAQGSRLYRNYRSNRYTDSNKSKKSGEYSIYSLQKDENNPSSTEDSYENRDRTGSNEREQLYEAYNLLHTLAQVPNLFVL
jgi:hypothetical protein